MRVESQVSISLNHIFQFVSFPCYCMGKAYGGAILLVVLIIITLNMMVNPGLINHLINFYILMLFQ